jgi:hypothetical protein
MWAGHSSRTAFAVALLDALRDPIFHGFFEPAHSSTVVGKFYRFWEFTGGDQLIQAAVR